MKNLTTKERLQFFVKEMGYGRNKFEEYAGIGSGYLSSKSTSITSDTIEKVIAKFPNLNLEWLLTGNGLMIIPEAENTNITLRQLKSDYFNQDEKLIPLYELDASAGLTVLFDNQNKQIPIDVIKIPQAPNCDGALYVRGDSMYPIIKAGDILCYKVITDFENIRYGNIYLLDINDGDDQYLTVKYVQKSDKGDNYLKLVSENGHHSPKDEKKNNIRSMAIVKMWVRMQDIT